MLTLDASRGEGGGQVLRTALALSVLTRRPVTLSRIRARRSRSGLQPQHLTAVRALAAISDASLSGDALDSTAVTFSPRTLRGGSYRFDIGAVKASAGSVSLLFQALLLPLAFADCPSRLTLRGGTHVPWSPPVPYLTQVFLPTLRQVGVEADITLRRPGWYPAGGGEIEATIVPDHALGGLGWDTPQPPSALTGLSAVSRLPAAIAERQRSRAVGRLRERGLEAHVALSEDASALGPGSLLFLCAAGETSRAGFSALGRRGLRAEAVADAAVEPLLDYLDSGAAVDSHLADQLLPFLALAREASAFTCPLLTDHLRTVAWVVQEFLPARIELMDRRPARVRIVPPGTRAPAR